LKQIVLVKPGMVSDGLMKKLERAGAIVVETSDFDAFKIISAELTLPTDDFAIAALDAITNGGYDSTRKTFLQNILAVLKDRKGKQ
jgi:hypothetical protein